MDTDTQVSQDSLQKFFESVQDREISAADFLKNALCYDETRVYLENNPDAVTRLYGATPEGRKKIIGEVVAAVQRGSPPEGAQNLTQFKPRKEQFAESHPNVLSPKNVADIVELTGSVTQKQRQHEVDRLKIPEIVETYAKQLRQQQRDAILKVLSEPINETDVAGAREEYLVRVDQSGAPDKHELKIITEKILDQENLPEKAVAELNKTNDVIRVVVQHVDTPKIFTENFLEKIAVAEDVTPAIIANSERFANFAVAVNAPANLEGFTLGAFASGAKVAPALEAAIENLSFLQAWDSAGGIDGITKSLGADVVSSDAFQKLLRSGNDLATGLRGQKVLHEAEGLVHEIFTAPPSQDMLDYLGALHNTGTTVVGVRQFSTARLYAAHPIMFHFKSGSSPLNFLLRLGEKRAVAGAAGVAVSTGVKAWSAGAAKSAVSAFLTKFLSFLGADAIEAVSGPIGWAVWAITNILPWIAKGVRSIVAPIGALFSSASTGIAGAFRGSLNLPATPKSWVDRNAILIILIVALGLPLLATSAMFTNMMTSFPTNTGTGGSYNGPIQYTGPAPSGPLQCLNFNVSPTTFGEIQAGPLTSNQGNTINSAVNEYPQLGLYNCLLTCPQNQINIYGDGNSDWWGWTVNSNSVVIYNGFFAGSSHKQARLVAHELAHTLAATRPEIFSAFLYGTTNAPRGYCGCLGTYPSGTGGGACSPLETEDETFAEAAAMFLTGENLQSICPAAYNFMNNLFSQCAK